MKDCYYILGVTSKASSEEIKKAYRKLSTKFHPDKNDRDAFFEERFKEIQEAYEILSDVGKKAIYERQYEQRFGNTSTSNGTSYNNFYPVIDTFTAAPTKIYDGDEVEFRWNVFNADSVQIDKVGRLPAKGTKRIRITGLRSAKSIKVTLSATNTHIGKTETKVIELSNQAHEDIYREVSKGDSRTRNNENNEQQGGDKETDTTPWDGIISFIIVSLIAIAITTLFGF